MYAGNYLFFGIMSVCYSFTWESKI